MGEGMCQSSASQTLWCTRISCTLTWMLKCRFWFSKSSVGPETLHFSHVPRECYSCWSVDHTLSSIVVQRHWHGVCCWPVGRVTQSGQQPSSASCTGPPAAAWELSSLQAGSFCASFSMLSPWESHPCHEITADLDFLLFVFVYLLSFHQSSYISL